MTTVEDQLRSEHTDEMIEAALLSARVHTVETATHHFGDQLAKHVNECAALQKRVLVIGCITLGWIVAHSPEGLKVVGKIVEAVLP